MTAQVLPLKPNWRTHERQRQRRLATRDRLIARIGINPADAPLFDGNLLALAHAECAWWEMIKPKGRPVRLVR